MLSLVDFLNASPTAFHSTRAIRDTLSRAGYLGLEERDEWSLKPGGKYFVTRNDSSLLAFHLAEESPLSGLRMAVCHTDSPGLKLRLPDALPQEGGLLRIPVEVYGGATLPVWLDRPLKFCGRACLRDSQGNLHLELLDCPDVQAVIPNPPIHFVDLNGGFKYNPQNQLAAILPYPSLAEFLSAILPEGFPLQPPEKFRGELYLADSQGAALLGPDGQLVQSPRLDNLTSCHSVLGALCAVKAPARSILGGFFDLEEVGSNFQSAGSNFLLSVLTRIANALGGDTSSQALPRMLADSLCLSIDVAHAYHPNFPELFDKPMAPFVGMGPTLKYHANQCYATTLPGAALLLEIADEAGIPLQEFTPRSDSRCGSTIGRIVASELGIPVMDIGVAIWAMHSIRETCAAKDVASQTELVSRFFAG